jgi:branched-chain amino acid transport system permease protein
VEYQLAILVIASIVAVLYSCAYGWTMEKIAYKPLRKAPRLSALISAIGMSLFLQNYVLLAQTSDFLPFPNLIPDFKFLEPIAHTSFDLRKFSSISSPPSSWWP